MNWGIIGLGNIAQSFSEGFFETENSRLLAVSSSNISKLEYFSKKGIIILSSDINTKTSKNYTILKAKNLSHVSKYLRNINSKAILVRPDRFILASARSNKDVRVLFKKYSSILR